MMILSVIIVIISCLIQGTMSNYLGYTYVDLSLFSTIYILIALLILKPYFTNEKKYFILLIVSGIIMDIVYTNTFILNTCLFILCYYFSKTFHFFFPYNLFTINISNLLAIFLYHIVSFLFLFILQYDNYTIGVLLKILSHSIIMTIAYTSILYGITAFVQQKLQLREVK